MRLKRNTLFMKRNISIDRSVYKDYAFSRNRNTPFGDIRVVSDANCAFDKEASVKELSRNLSYDEPPDKYDKEILHCQLKPLILMLRVLGSFPVEISKSGL
jgi:hypothetical protein